jgi:hypothetical protein
MGGVTDFLSKFGNLKYSDEWEEPSLPSTGANALDAFMGMFSTLTESFWFYNHTVELRFDKEKHKYYRVDPELGNLIEVRGVTNQVHIIDRSLALTPWAAKKVAEKILRIVPLSETKDEFGSFMLAPMTLEDFTALVMQAKTAPKDILIEAGDIGHLAHKCLEDSIQYAIDNTNGIVLELRNLPNDEKAVHCANAAFAWMQKHKVRWLSTERKVYSLEHNYAGTADGTAIVSSCDDPSCCMKAYKDHRSLIDWKSSNYLYIEYCYQTASYLAAEVEEFGIKFDDRWILRLGKNEEEAGKFEPWYLDESTFAEDFAGFLTCLQLTALVASVTERMQVQKKGVRAAKKIVKAEQKAIAEMKAKVEKAEAKAQRKLDRAVEKERIKADAKKAREETKRAAKLGKGVLSLPNTGAVEGSEISNTTELERPKPVHEVPGKAEDTPASAMVPEAASEPLKVAEDYEETPVTNVPFVIPEEG